MVQFEPQVLAKALRRQPSSLENYAESKGIAALHFSDDASNLEGANPLAPRTFHGEKTVRRFTKRIHIEA